MEFLKGIYWWRIPLILACLCGGAWEVALEIKRKQTLIRECVLKLRRKAGWIIQCGSAQKVLTPSWLFSEAEAGR